MKKDKFKSGMTLVELMVAIAIMSLGMGVFTLLSAKAWGFKSYALEQATSTLSANQVVKQIVSELRTVRQAEDGSYPVEAIGEKSLTVYLDVDKDGKAERVHYFLDGDILKKGISKYDAGAYQPEEVQVLLNYVTNESKGAPLFVYYDNSFHNLGEIDNTMENLDIYNVRLVRIHLWVNIKPIVAPENINLESVAELRNLNEF